MVRMVLSKLFSRDRGRDDANLKLSSLANKKVCFRVERRNIILLMLPLLLLCPRFLLKTKMASKTQTYSEKEVFLTSGQKILVTF